MTDRRALCGRTFVLAMWAMMILTFGIAARAMAAQDAQQIPMSTQWGSVKSVSGNTIVMATDAGTDLTVTLQDTTKVLRVPPGSKDLKSATAMQLTDLKPGDRILVRGRVPADAKVFPAAIVVAMKAEDLQAKKARDVQEWQTHGIGGIVSAVDPAAGTITISTRTAAGSKPVIVTTTKATVLRRYAADSTKFDDAKPAPIDAIKPGDQLRARGAKNDDGTQFAAQEIVSGSFRNIAGLVTAIDPAAKTVTVTDLLTKKSVVVKVTDQTQLRKLQPQMAQLIAMRLKGAAAGGGANGNGAAGAGGGTGTGNPNASTEQPTDNSGAAGAKGAGQRGPGGRGGAGDFQQILNRLPNSVLTDFQRGDAVMVVATSGTDDSTVTAITMLGGVEAILSAPAGISAASQAALLSPWSLGGGPAADAGGAQ
ncbi:MAG: DUF5666 domain-containing protein [Candidatus Acidiferrales bacterium]